MHLPPLRPPNMYMCLPTAHAACPKMSTGTSFLLQAAGMSSRHRCSPALTHEETTVSWHNYTWPQSYGAIAAPSASLAQHLPTLGLCWWDKLHEFTSWLRMHACRHAACKWTRLCYTSHLVQSEAVHKATHWFMPDKVDMPQ